MKVTGLFGGSFNPPHCGHIALARAVVESGLVDDVWMMLSPLNPLKGNNEDMASDAHRWNMLRLAANGQPGLYPCDVELTMPRPSYTIDTLQLLMSRFPDRRFRLVIGQDNWEIFNSWRRADLLLQLAPPIVYRRGEDAPPVTGAETLHNVPLLPVSSTMIRRMIAEGRDVNNLLPPEVYSYIKEHNLYKK